MELFEGQKEPLWFFIASFVKNPAFLHNTHNIPLGLKNYRISI